MAFHYCAHLTTITVEEANTSYSSVDGILFNKNKTKLVRCPEDKTGAVTVLDSVTSIGRNAFERCKDIESVTLPANLTSIGERAFYSSTAITSITIPTGVTSIGERAFTDCTNLESITVEEANTSYASVDGILFNKDKTELIACPCGKTGAFIIPDSVTTIDTLAFYYCMNLTSLTIPAGVTSIGEMAFYDWGSSQTIYIKGLSAAPSSWDDNNWNEDCYANIIWNAEASPSAAQ